MSASHHTPDKVLRRCRDCRASCGVHFVYVIGHEDQPWSKVGIARRVSSRMAGYRTSGVVPSVRLVIQTPCEHQSLNVEFAAHNRIERKHQRVQGDWTTATPDESAAAVLGVIRAGKAHL